MVVKDLKEILKNNVGKWVVIEFLIESKEGRILLKPAIIKEKTNVEIYENKIN